LNVLESRPVIRPLPTGDPESEGAPGGAQSDDDETCGEKAGEHAFPETPVDPLPDWIARDDTSSELDDVV
jgi:hypothetical protein